jgi:hypothetical protein
VSALAEQHERWSGARERLWNARQPRQKAARDIVHRTARILPTPQGASAYLERKILRQTPEPAWPAQPPPVFYDDAAGMVTTVTSASIMADVCRAYRISLDELTSDRRYDRLVAARQLASFRMTVELDMSLTAIGRRLKKDHSSILVCLQALSKKNPEAAAALAANKEKRKRRAEELRHRAVAMYMNGAGIKEIMEAMPISRSVIQAAVAAHRAGHLKDA